MLIGCGTNRVSLTTIVCPNILFAAEHKDYFTHLNNQSTSLGNISYRASIYGTKFNKECFLTDENFQADLSLFFT